MAVPVMPQPDDDHPALEAAEVTFPQGETHLSPSDSIIHMGTSDSHVTREALADAVRATPSLDLLMVPSDS